MWVTAQMILMTPHLKKLTGTLQFNTTQFRAFFFCVTRTTGNPVYAFLERLVANKLILNTAKTEFMLIESRQRLTSQTIRLQ